MFSKRISINYYINVIHKTRIQKYHKYYAQTNETLTANFKNFIKKFY